MSRNSGGGATRARAKLVIQIDVDEHRVVDEAIRALEGCTQLFVHQGRLVEIVRREGGGVRVRELSQVRLRDILTRRATLRRGNKFVHPPEWLMQGLLQRPSWRGMRVLEGFSPGPFLRPDGTPCVQPGYDADTRIFCAPHRLEVAVPPNPNWAEAREACDELLLPVIDFPFAGPSDRAVYLALLLTVFARFSYDGLTPMFLIDGNAAGVGKTKLVDIVGLIATGQEPPHMSEVQNDEEMRKRITSLVMDGSTFAFLDNISGRLGGACLDNVLTSRTWKDRKLGTQNMVEARSRLTWVATGNNVAIAGDLARRLVVSRLVSDEEAPEERGSFQILDLRAYVLERRARLVAAALTILVAYARAGRPQGAGVAFGSFEEWSSLVRGAICWLDEPDPLQTRRALRSLSDDDRESRAELLRALERFGQDRSGFTAREIADHLRAEPSSPLHLVFPTRRSQGGESPTATDIGRVLKRSRDLVVEGRVLRCLRKTNVGQLWRVERSGDARDDGDDGDAPSSASQLKPPAAASASRPSPASPGGRDHAL